MGKIPDRWKEYARVGAPISGTRFICFKVPLTKETNVQHGIPEEEMLYPTLLPTLIPNLGLVIDLTNTAKYYPPQDILSLGIEYHKLNVQGHQVPSRRNYMEFKKAVTNFLKANENNDKLIGVHCTHGLNRSGYLVCRYMVHVLKYPSTEAFEKFETARGHKMERNNYLDDIKRIERLNVPSIAIDTDSDKGTQCPPGFWISKESLPRRTSTDSDSEAFDRPPKPDGPNQVVNLRGYVNVDRTDLIPDGRGGYFVHVERSDISRFEPRETDAAYSWRRNDYQVRNNGLLNGHMPYPPQQPIYPQIPTSNNYAGLRSLSTEYEQRFQAMQSAHIRRTNDQSDRRKRTQNHASLQTEVSGKRYTSRY